MTASSRGVVPGNVVCPPSVAMIVVPPSCRTSPAMPNPAPGPSTAIVSLTEGKPSTRETMAVIGPGTGLGMAGLVRHEGGTTIIATEGGHTTLPGTTPREDAVIAYLRRQFGHASAERALSGPGLENLYSAIAAIDNAPVPRRTAAEITRHALERSCPTCLEAVEMFCAMLGTVAGNLALMLRARGGVYISGGIAPRVVDLLAQSGFRARFSAKGRFQPSL